MATSYPSVLDNPTNPTSADNLDSGTVPHATQHTNANDAIKAIETELGTLPKGSSASVKARLDTLDTTVDAKAPLDSPTFTGTVVLPSTTSIGTVSNTELSYVDGVTSAIQTQIDTKVGTSALAGRFNNLSTGVDVFDRRSLRNTGLAFASGTMVFVFFTPERTLTVSQVSMVSHTTLSSGLTLARMGLYTFDETTMTLVARTASDTTLLNSGSTLYTRSFATAGGYPANYTLQAGIRYAFAYIGVGTNAGSTYLDGSAVLPAVFISLTPIMSGTLAGQSDLPGSYASALGTASSAIWARFS